MAFLPSFTISQILGLPRKLVVTDTSTGSDVLIVSRVVFLQKSDGTFLVPEGTTTTYIVWPIGTTTITIDCLDKDYALFITVNWLKVDASVLYTSDGLFGLTLYNENFDYTLTQQITGNTLLINDNNFYENKSELRTNIDSGNQAISQASDILGAQQCYNRATDLRLASPYSFNANS